MRGDSASAAPFAPKLAAPRVQLILLLLAAFLLHVAGLQRTLPILPDPDEGIFVEAAVRVASTGNLDPGFYGNPGTTTIYPLALGAHLWHAWTQYGMFLRPDPNLLQHYYTEGWQYYFLGRLLAVAYNLLAIALTVLVGKRAFGWRVGLAAGWFYTFCALVLLHARLVRTDTAATFFGMVALYLMLRLLDRPSYTLQMIAGISIGFAIASRYFMVVLAGVLLAVDVAIYLRARRTSHPGRWGPPLLGMAMIPLAFVAAVPTLLPQWAEVLHDLRTEARATHLGADGLSFAGNLWWYISAGFPQSVEWPLAVASAIGVAIILWEWRLRPLLLLLYAALFVVGISLSALHWHRWLIPILPVLMMAAAVALERMVQSVARDRSPVFAARLFSVGVVLLMAWTGARSILLDVRGAGTNTRLEARAWMLQNLPAGSHLLQEPYSAPLSGTPLVGEEVRALADVGDMRLIRGRGYDYAVVSSDIYNRFLAEPARYPAEVAFYENLFSTGDLVREFAPAWNESGPVIRVYAP